MVSVFRSHRFVLLDLSRINCELPYVYPPIIVLKSRRGGLMVGHLSDGSGIPGKGREEFILTFKEPWNPVNILRISEAMSHALLKKTGDMSAEQLSGWMRGDISGEEYYKKWSKHESKNET